MEQKLFDSERRVMEVLWEQGELPAREIARILAERVGWNKNTTYTVLKKCVEKGAAGRTDPGFVCRPRITREQVRKREARDLADRLFGGSPSLLVASLIGDEALPEEEVERLRALIDAL